PDESEADVPTVTSGAAASAPDEPTAESSGLTPAAGLGLVAPADAVTTNPRVGLISTLGHAWLLTGRSTVDRVTWAGRQGSVEIARVPPDIILVHMSGVLEAAAARVFQAHLPELLERHRPTHVFFHLSTIKSYPA